MNQKVNDSDNAPAVEPISSPSGLNLNPKPPEPRRVSKRAAGAIGVVVCLLLFAFAYGGYKRTKTAQAKADQAGIPKALAPATAAGTEFTRAIPAGNAAAGQLKAPDDSTLNSKDSASACGFDPKSGQAYRFDPSTGAPCARQNKACGVDARTGQRDRYDPMTGQSCDGQAASIERVAIRQAPHAVAQQPQQPSPEEVRMQELYKQERDAMQAPTGVHLASESSNTSGVGGLGLGSQSDLAQVAALGAALGASRDTNQPNSSFAGLVTSTQSSSSDYDAQNMQSRKEKFIEVASAKKTDDYLKSTRTAPLSQYEIKAGWEIPGVLEQSLNSDLPGEIKALVMSNVYDTATGRYLLIPQGSRLIGKYDSRIAYGQDGVEVIWNRIIFPDASSVDLSGMVGLDSHGNSGLRDKVDRHYKRLFGFAALTSAFTAAFEISQRRNQSVLSTPSASASATAAVGREFSETGAQITRRNLNVQPTIEVPAGYKFTIRVNQDILFDAPYDPENADPGLVNPQQGLRKRSGL